MGRRSADRHPGLLGSLIQVLAWMVILCALALIAVAVVVPRVGGATPYTVLTGSMEPTMPPGTLVVVRPVDPKSLAVGDVITYQLESGKPTVVTHRLVGVSATLKGETIFSTQGDANNTPDAELVKEVQIRGKRWYFIPHVGKITSTITESQRGAATAIIVIGLLGYAAFMFIGASRDRRKPGPPTKLTEQIEEGTAV